MSTSEEGAKSNNWLDHTSAIVLEHGVKIRRDTADPQKWRASGPHGERTGTMQAFKNALGVDWVQAILPREGRPDLPDIVWTFSDKPAAALEMRAQHLLPYGQGRYIAEATIYHCRNLATKYADIVDHVPELSSGLSRNFGIHWQTEPHFEFDALLSTTIRAFEVHRDFLWTQYGPATKQPSKLATAIKHIRRKGVPADVQPLFDTFKEAVLYRNCIHHTAQFGAKMPEAYIDDDADVWRMTALIPDNPAADYDHLTYTERRDCLSYGWKYANRVVDLCELAEKAIESQPNTWTSPGLMDTGFRLPSS